MTELKPTYGNNFLLAFDYKPPRLQEEKIQNILYIHSTQQDQSRKLLERLQDLYPKTNFSLLKNANADFSKLDSLKKLEITNYTTPTLTPDIHATESGHKLLEKRFDLVFFGLNLDARPEINPLENSFAGRYDNIFNFIIHSGLYERSYAIDNQFAVYPCQHLEHLWRGERFSLTWDICGHKLPLPWTQLSLREKETLFQLAQNSYSEGAIVNIGHFLGGLFNHPSQSFKTGQSGKGFFF